LLGAVAVANRKTGFELCAAGAELASESAAAMPPASVSATAPPIRNGPVKMRFLFMIPLGSFGPSMKWVDR
jgi:hypothetical protein